MADLITSARATQNGTLSALLASNAPYLASLITAASDAVRTYCRRDLDSNVYSHYFDGGIYKGEALRLRQFPVTHIARVAANPTQVLLVSNAGSTCQRATVETVASTDGLTTASVVLTSVASGVSTTTTLSTTTYPTLATLATAIGAVSEWSASVYQNIPTINTTLFPSADLRVLQGAVTAIGPGAYLEAFAEDLYPFGSGGSNLTFGFGQLGGYGWRLKGESGELFGIFPRGKSNIRVVYTAGYATVPQAIQEAVVQQCQDLYQAGLINSSVSQLKLGDYSYQNKSTTASRQVSGKVAQLLAPYVDYSRIIHDS